MMRAPSPNPRRRAVAAVSLALVVLGAACANEPAAPAATAPVNDPAARWFAHVEMLANDNMRGRETGSPEHRKAADYVADRFTQAGLEPGGTAGYLQPIAFHSRRIVEAESSLALVRRGKTEPVTLGRRPRSACGSIQRRASMPDWCSPATACRSRK
jgi:hypothetical protein